MTKIGPSVSAPEGYFKALTLVRHKKLRIKDFEIVPKTMAKSYGDRRKETSQLGLTNLNRVCFSSISSSG